MRMIDLIHEKRAGQEHATAAIEWLVGQVAGEKAPDYQVAAWLMAVCFQGLSTAETAALTEAMMRSGEVWDWSKLAAPTADKHSTGGVGDKVSLPLAPLAAACGLAVPMVSGRGLGHTGGTLDKLESIPGFDVNLPRARVARQLKKIGVAMTGQTPRFVPADRRLYALRDVTGTVESIPLIVASIMSKKLAEGARSLVLDVKFGSGAFMVAERDARALAKAMVETGKRMGRNVAALLTDMNQPTGRAIGNANEVVEAIECLRGEGPADLRELVEAETALMLTLAGVERDDRAARIAVRKALESGRAIEKWAALIEAQGGDPRVIDDPRRLPTAPKKAEVAAPKAGWLTRIDTRTVGLAAGRLGAGRMRHDEGIDHGVGFWYEARLGERVEKGQPIFTVRYRKETAWRAARELLEACFVIEARQERPGRLIKARIT